MKTLLVGLALVLIACGTPSPREAPQRVAPFGQAATDSYEVDPDDPCALLTPQEVSEAIGLEVEEEREVPSKSDGVKGQSSRLCLYDTTEPYGSIVVYLNSEVAEKDFRKNMRRDPINTEEVPDVGDLAFIHGGAGIQILVDDTAVSVSVQMFDSVEEAELALRNVGKVAAERLRS